MRLLQLHVNWIEYQPTEKEIAAAEPVEKKKYRLEDILVLLTCIEKTDTEAVGRKAVSEVKNFLEKIKSNRLLIYPFAHLSSNLAKPDEALKIIKAMEEHAKKLKIETYRAPFGWTKALSISVKGHPLAEQSKVFGVEVGKTGKKKPAVIEKEYLILTPEGKIYSPKEYKFKKNEEKFKILVEKEALGKELKGGEEPEYIKHCKKFGIDWEPMSDVGHMRYGPEGALIFDLASEYSRQIATSLGIPIYVVKGTNMFNLDLQPVREHAELFGERLYSIDIDKKRFILRYAACHQQFAMIKDWQISYKHLPFGAFEVADSYRYEQSGELLLSFRLRRLNMPDLHIFCKDIEETKKWFLKLHEKIYNEVKILNEDYVSLYNLTSREFFEENKEFFSKLVKLEGKPVLLSFYPKGVNYYWILNIEYHTIDKMNRPREIGTVQIDVGNSKRFEIKFTDKDGKEKYPTILHTAIIGTIERYLYTLFDVALKMKNPMLPLWISPTQVRICPVNNSYLKHAQEIADKISDENIRVDIDDRSESIDRKIRDGEVAWIPLQIVVGEREVKSKLLSVRFRESGRVQEMSLNDIIDYVKESVKGYPFRPSCMPILVSQRPVIR